MSDRNFAQESHRTRVSRDVFLYDKSSMEFLVKPWGGDHRSALQYGNAYGSFMYRPPKDDDDLEKQRQFTTKMLIRGEGAVLAYDTTSGVIGFKTKELNKVLRKRAFPYDDTSFRCVIMPSKMECRTSSITASMTVLAYFLPVDRNKLVNIPLEYRWLSKLDATDPSKNVHASCVSHFLYGRECNKQFKTFRGSNVRKIMQRLSEW